MVLTVNVLDQPAASVPVRFRTISHRSSMLLGLCAMTRNPERLVYPFENISQGFSSRFAPGAPRTEVMARRAETRS